MCVFVLLSVLYFVRYLLLFIDHYSLSSVFINKRPIGKDKVLVDSIKQITNYVWPVYYIMDTDSIEKW